MYYICDLSHKVSLRLINVKTACYSCQRRKKNPFWRTENNLVLVIWGSSHISHLVILIKCHMPQLGICCPTPSKLMIVKDILHLGYLHLQICNWSSHKWGKQTGVNILTSSIYLCFQIRDDLFTHFTATSCHYFLMKQWHFTNFNITW